jgi:exoribonuclease R
MSEITAGLHQGRYHQGKLRVNRYNPFVAYVGSESVGEEILINGRQDMNRAFDGDVVAVEVKLERLQTEMVSTKKNLSSSSHIISTVKQEMISLAVKLKFMYFCCCR